MVAGLKDLAPRWTKGIHLHPEPSVVLHSSPACLTRQVVTPGTEEAAWLTLISERAFARHTAALASGIAAAPEPTPPTLPHTSVLAPGVVLPRAGPEAEEAMGKVPGAAVLAAAEEAPADAGGWGGGKGRGRGGGRRGRGEGGSGGEG